MGDLIPTYPISEFKKLKTGELKQLKSCEITADGEYLFTFMNPQTDFIKMQSEYMGQLSNSVAGKDIEELAELVTAGK